MGSGETAVLAEFAHGLRYEDIPAAVRGKAKDILVDQIGVQLGCSDLPWCREVHELQTSLYGQGGATVVRYGNRLPLPQAVFTNATFGHAFEFDDANPKVHGHLGCEIVPAALAVAEQEHRSGRELLTAFVAAYELRGRVGWAVSPDFLDRGGPQYVTSCGPFGAAAVAGRLLGLSAEQMHHALGITGSFCGGLMEYDQSGGSVKRILGGIAGQGGVQSALLARAGITGPTAILEGKRGFLRIFCSSYRPERLIEELGTQWTLLEALFKPYSCMGGIHPAIDALLRFMADGLRPSAVESIDVGYPESMAHHAGIVEPRDLLGMQFSTSYSLAITLLCGRNTPEEYTEKTLHDPKVAALAARIHVVHDPELEQYWGAHLPASVQVRTADGRVMRAAVPDAKGSPQNPMTSSELDAKFRSLASGILGEVQSERLLRQLRDIDSVGDVATIVPLLVRSQAE